MGRHGDVLGRWGTNERHALGMDGCGKGDVDMKERNEKGNERKCHCRIMCRKRTREWSDESSVDSSDADDDDGVDGGWRENERAGVDDDSQGEQIGESSESEGDRSEGSEGDRSEGGLDDVFVEGHRDGNGPESGSESSWTTDTDYGSQELIEIYDVVDAEYRHGAIYRL